MKIYSSHYQLTSLVDLNAKTNERLRSGTLLKIDFGGGKIGFADLHPWPELGDPSLEQCLQERGTLFQRALEIAEMDGEARARGILLQTQVPASHRLIRDARNLRPQDSPQAIYKVKCGGDLSVETPKLQEIVKNLREIQKLRLDFNMTLAPEDFQRWMDASSWWLLPRLDFVEDPSPFEPKVYTQWRSLIAIDRVSVPDNFQMGIKVVKPVRENIETLPQFLNDHIDRIVFTHNMDHPLGQRAARVCATQFYQKYPRFSEAGGLDSFDGYVLRDEALVEPQEIETGLGLDRFLARQTWTPI
jgi:O-succinylbenzoate synthase